MFEGRNRMVEWIIAVSLCAAVGYSAYHAKKINYGIIQDGNQYSERLLVIIRAMMNYFGLQRDLWIPFTTHLIDHRRPLSQQMRVICGEDSDLPVLFSITSCALLTNLTLQTSELGIPHFVVNDNHCPIDNGTLLADRVQKRDVTQAIMDVIHHKSYKDDIIILHDANYETDRTVKVLLKELSRRDVRYSYLLIDTNVTRFVQKVGQVRRGSMELSIVVLADFSIFKSLLDKMYEYDILDPTITYLIVNDGWEPSNPEIEEPQRISYNIDIQLMLLKRRLGDDISRFLADIFATANNNSELFNRQIPHLTREDTFIAGAVSGVMLAVEQVMRMEEMPFGWCPSRLRVRNETFAAFIYGFLSSNKVSADAIIYDLMRNIPVDTEKDIFRHVAQWTAREVPRFREVESERKLLFENRTIKIALPFNPPYTFQNGNGSEEESEGALNKLFEYLTKFLKFRYEVLQPEDNEWGVKISDVEWSGAVKMLLDRRVDLIPFLGITQGRHKILDFSEPVMTSACGILVQKPREPPRAFIFLRPFTTQVWISIAIMIPIIGVVLHSVNSWSPYYGNNFDTKCKGGLFKLHNCIWYIYGAILQQGGVHLPDAVSARIVVSTWWLFVLVTMATYSGNLIAFLTFPEADWKVSSIEELARKESLLVYITEGTSIQQEIDESPMESFLLLQKRLKEAKNAFVVSNTTFALSPIKDGEAVHIDDIYVLSNIINTESKRTGYCKLAIVPNHFQEIFLAIATRKGSPYMKDMNRLIRYLWHGGLMQHWADHYSKLSHECTFTPTKMHGGRKDVTLKDLQGAFYMLFLGLLLSLLTVMTEIGWNKFKDRQIKEQKMNDFSKTKHLYVIGNKTE